MVAEPSASPLDDYDGTLRIYYPDDLYLIGSAGTLLRLRDAIDQALRGVKGECGGIIVDGEGKRIHVLCVQPHWETLPPYRSKSEKPTADQIAKPKRARRPEPESPAPRLAGVLSGYE